jgi:CRISPR system Cascade subunit CasD
MKTVLLRLEGPLQSWGTQGRFGIRDTDREPSKSAVLGLCAAALGMERDDAEGLRILRGLAMSVRVDREGTLLEDYHTVGGGTFRGRPHSAYGAKGQVIVTRRFYLADASFLVALGDPEGTMHAYVNRIAKALQSPVWPLFLGRRSCVPSVPVFVRLSSMGHESAVMTEPAHPRAAGPRVRIISERAPDDLVAQVYKEDVPLSFTSHGYGRRLVAEYEALIPGTP